MPELPEVQTVVTDLKSKIINQKIVQVQVFCPKIFNFDQTNIINQTILDIWRRGKYIILKLEKGFLVIHLRMTGRLFAIAKKPNQLEQHAKHLHVILELSDQFLLFQDQRKFGKIQFCHEIAWLDAKLGPEPLSADFTIKYLSQICTSTRQIKALLLDQSQIAGLGNIYVDEVLWQVGVNPQIAACDLSAEKLNLLHGAIQSILQQAIDLQGTTFLSYAFDGTKQGNFLAYLKVFKRAKQACLRCGTNIIKIKVAQRGTHICPACQKL